MTPTGRSVAAAVLAAVPLLLPLVVTAPSGADPSAGPSADAGAPAVGNPWQVSQAQWISGQNFLMNSVHVPTAGDVWAVGYRYGSVGGATEFRTIIEHSTGGGAFTIVPSPDREGAPATNFLQDIHGVSSSDLWTVGWSRNPGESSRTLVEHWDGSAWSITASADPGQFGNILNGVVAVSADDVWAVGARQDSFYQTPLAEHWNGSAWSAAAVPNPAFCTGHSYLSDVVARSASDVWATGICSSHDRGGDQGFVVRWNGTRWVLPAMNAQVPTGASLFGASVFRSTMWFVGSQRNVGAFAMRNTSPGWATVPLAEPNGSFAAVVARGGGTAWGVGTGLSSQPPFAAPGAVRLTSAGGTATTVPVDFGSLRGAAYDPAGKVWAVGTQLPGAYNTALMVSRAAP